jgi:hypothetical protein
MQVEVPALQHRPHDDKMGKVVSRRLSDPLPSRKRRMVANRRHSFPLVGNVRQKWNRGNKKGGVSEEK